MSVLRTLTQKDTLGNTSLVSESGRTQVTAVFDARGKGIVIVSRDGKTVERIDLGSESNVDYSTD